MTLFKTWKKQKLVISDVDPTYKVKYLGNVQTALMKGDGCVDKPTAVLWNNYVKNGQSVGLDMTLTVCGSGLKAITKEQGLTEYRAHRVSYCIAHPEYPKLFVWVYRHEGKKMKVELRCHAVLCKSDRKAKLMAVQLHEKLSFALNEFLRDKTRRQNTRLTVHAKQDGVGGGATSTKSAGHAAASRKSGMSVRNKFLSTAQNFKPSVENSSAAPKLGAITEGLEEEEEVEEESEDEEPPLAHNNTGEAERDGEDSLDVDRDGDEGALLEEMAPYDGPGPVVMTTQPSASSYDADRSSTSGDSTEGDIVNGMFGLEMGNDIEALREDLRNHADDSDAESSESGFSEQGDSGALLTTATTITSANGGVTQGSSAGNQAHIDTGAHSSTYDNNENHHTPALNGGIQTNMSNNNSNGGVPVTSESRSSAGVPSQDNSGDMVSSL